VLAARFPNCAILSGRGTGVSKPRTFNPSGRHGRSKAAAKALLNFE
jgi:hypothetical protein